MKTKQNKNKTQPKQNELFRLETLERKKEKKKKKE